MKGDTYMRISKNSCAITALENPNPIKSIRRGQTVYVYEPSSEKIISGTISMMDGAVGNEMILLKTENGIHSYWRKELFDNKEEPEKELDLRLHPVREKVISEISSVKDLISYCIRNDFTNDNDAADMRAAVSVKSRQLLGFDPFEDRDPSNIKEGSD